MRLPVMGRRVKPFSNLLAKTLSILQLDVLVRGEGAPRPQREVFNIKDKQEYNKSKLTGYGAPCAGKLARTV